MQLPLQTRFVMKERPAEGATAEEAREFDVYDFSDEQIRHRLGFDPSPQVDMIMMIVCVCLILCIAAHFTIYVTGNSVLIDELTGGNYMMIASVLFCLVGVCLVYILLGHSWPIFKKSFVSCESVSSLLAAVGWNVFGLYH